MQKFLQKLNKWQFYLLLILILGVLFAPISTQSVPEWKVKVTDKYKKPLENIRVQQSWRDYKYGDGGYESICTNGNGEVIFSERELAAGLLYRVFFNLLSWLPIPHVTSSGTSAYVQVYDKNYTSLLYYRKDRERKTIEKGNFLISEITVEKSDIIREDFACNNK